VIVTCKGSRVELWSLSERRPTRSWDTRANIRSLSLAPSGDLILLACADGRLELCDVATGQRVQEFRGHRSLVYAVGFSICGRYVVSGSAGLGQTGTNALNLAGGVIESTLRLWDLLSGRQVHDFQGHRVPVNDIAFRPDGRTMLTENSPFGGHAFLAVWDVESGTQLRTIDQQILGLNHVSISPDGARVLSTGGTESTLRLWDVDGGYPLRVYDGQPSRFKHAAFSPTGDLILGVADDHSIKVWPTDSKQEFLSLPNSHCVRTAAFSHDGRLSVRTRHA
jgi:WD40 repeat protein